MSCRRQEQGSAAPRGLGFPRVRRSGIYHFTSTVSFVCPESKGHGSDSHALGPVLLPVQMQLPMALSAHMSSLASANRSDDQQEGATAQLSKDLPKVPGALMALPPRSAR